LFAVAVTVGIECTLIVNEAEELHTPLLTVTVYTPWFVPVTPLIEVFWSELLKLFGPIQLYEVNPLGKDDKLSVSPSHKSNEFELAKAVGPGFTVIVIVSVSKQPAELYAETVYNPLFATVIFDITGF
jgi:hypothetical protein